MREPNLKPPLPPPLPVSKGPRGGDGIPQTPATKAQDLTGGTTRDGSGAAHQASTLVRNQTFDQIRKVPMERFAGLRELLERK